MPNSCQNREKWVSLDISETRYTHFVISKRTHGALLAYKLPNTHISTHKFRIVRVITSVTPIALIKLKPYSHFSNTVYARVLYNKYKLEWAKCLIFEWHKHTHTHLRCFECTMKLMDFQFERKHTHTLTFVFIVFTPFPKRKCWLNWKIALE